MADGCVMSRYVMWKDDERLEDGGSRIDDWNLRTMSAGGMECTPALCRYEAARSRFL